MQQFDERLCGLWTIPIQPHNVKDPDQFLQLPKTERPPYEIDLDTNQIIALSELQIKLTRERIKEIMNECRRENSIIPVLVRYSLESDYHMNAMTIEYSNKIFKVEKYEPDKGTLISDLINLFLLQVFEDMKVKGEITFVPCTVYSGVQVLIDDKTLGLCYYTSLHYLWTRSHKRKIGNIDQYMRYMNEINARSEMIDFINVLNRITDIESTYIEPDVWYWDLKSNIGVLGKDITYQ